MTGNASRPAPGIIPMAPGIIPVYPEKKKKKIKVKYKKKHNYSDSDSGSGSESDSSSTDFSSSSNGGIFMEGRRYAESALDRFARRDAARAEYEKHTRDRNAKSRGSNAKNRRQKRRSRSISTTSSSGVSISGSEVEVLEQVEEHKVTSTALKRLWKNVKHLRDKIQKLEHAISEIESDDPKGRLETSKTEIKQKLASSKEIEPGNESKEEIKSEDIAIDAPAKNVTCPVISNDEQLESSTEHTNEGPAKAKTKDDKTHETEASEINREPTIGDNEEKASDGDDEDSDDENKEGNEESNEDFLETDFELKYQFFDQRDTYELNRFSDDRIQPFIRVLWNNRNSDVSPDDIKATHAQEDKPAAGEMNILQVSIESKAFRMFISSITVNTSNQGVVRQGSRPPPPGMMRDPRKIRVPRTRQRRADNTVSFHKPFRWLIQNRELLEDHMRKLEDDALTATDSKVSSIISTSNGGDTPEGAIEDEIDRDLENHLGSQIRFLLDFLDEYLAKYLEKYRDARAGNLKSIRFEDLWMLYKPGDIIYCPLRTALDTANEPPEPSHGPQYGGHPGMRPAGAAQTTYRQGFGRDTPQAYKIISVAGGRRYASQMAGGGRMASIYAPLKLICYFLDIGGYRFDIVTDTFTFRPSDTEITITDLEAYPLAYASSGRFNGEEGMRKFLAARGKSFVQVCEASHKLYTGAAWTKSQINKEEIDTPVIVDFALAYQNIPPWRPLFGVPHIDFYNTISTRMQAESLEIATGSRSNRTVDWYWSYQTNLVNKARNTITETIQNYPAVGMVASDPAIPELVAAMEANGDILLLPGVVYAFALRDRKWVALDLTLLQDTQYEDGWKDLILPAGHKEMVRAVVENHAAGSRATGGMKKNSAEVDIVRGKGKGCIILLHGEPGVGKTSTAECVAAFTKRPLFPITCGDIGYEPDEVERNMQKHFTLAHKWGCVMLLDEADVFLAKRSKDDIKRNGLVSVFLRILEYYAGILFLTTNRVGSFDDAFRSRLHLTLYYPKLDREQTLQIFEMNIRRVRELNSKREQAGQQIIQVQDKKILKFARRNFETLSWNGRQIRNAFQTAIALSEFDVRDDEEGERQAVMSKKQFKTIADASIQFDNYLYHTHGRVTEADKARIEKVRWDHELEERLDKKPGLVDSSSESSSDSSSSSSDSSSDSSDSSSDAADSSDGGNEKRRRKKNKKKGKGKDKDKKSKKSESKNKKSRSKKDKHS